MIINIGVNCSNLTGQSTVQLALIITGVHADRCYAIAIY